MVSRFHQEELAVNLTANGSVRALIYAESTEAGISNSGRPMVGAFSTHRVPRLWTEILQGIEVGKWPAGFVPGTPSSYLFDFYPREMQDFCTTSAEGLRDQLREFFGLLRWRLNSNVSAGDQISPGQLEWSDDGRAWYKLRRRWSLSAQIIPEISLSPQVQGFMDDLVRTNTKEPLGRDIWHVAVKADPRTAIILAVTAVEVEVKRLISEVVPESEWFVANLPTPPIFRLIKSYLPTIIDIPSDHLPPRRLMGMLEKAVNLRNSFVHGGFPTSGGWAAASDMSPQDVEKVLEASSDLLWLFDLYRGRTWAISYLSEETKLSVRRTPAPEG
jgi:hypothetical protein